MTDGWFSTFTSSLTVFEPSHENMALFVLRKLILQMRMCSHPVELDVWFLVEHFVYFHTSCVRTSNALARLRRLTWAVTGRLCNKYHNLMSWLICVIWGWQNGHSKAMCTKSGQKKKIYVFQVSRPYLGFCPDPKHFIVNCEQNDLKFAGIWGKIY